MALRHRAEQRLRKLLEEVDGRIDPAALERLAALPAGWARAVEGMLAQVDEVLNGEERRSFRWTALGEREGRLEVAWSGARDSAVLVEQIVEHAVAEAGRACGHCGLPALGRAAAGAAAKEAPRCLLHAGLGPRLAGWRGAARELRQGLGELLGRFSSTAARTKAAATALPALMAEAQSYLRRPDGDAAVIIRQIRVALHRLDREARRSVGVSLTERG